MRLLISFIGLVFLGFLSDALPLKDSLAKENGEMIKDFDEGMSEAMNDKIGKDTTGEAISTDVDAITAEGKPKKDESATKRDEKTADEGKKESSEDKPESGEVTLKNKKLEEADNERGESEETPAADAKQSSNDGSGDTDDDKKDDDDDESDKKDGDDDESDKKDRDQEDVVVDKAKYGPVGKKAKSKNWLAEYPIGYPIPIDPIWPPIVYPYPMGWPWGSVPIVISPSSDEKKDDKKEGLKNVYRGYGGQMWPARAMRFGTRYVYPYSQTGR